MAEAAGIANVLCKQQGDLIKGLTLHLHPPILLAPSYVKLSFSYWVCSNLEFPINLKRTRKQITYKLHTESPWSDWDGNHKFYIWLHLVVVEVNNTPSNSNHHLWIIFATKSENLLYNNLQQTCFSPTSGSWESSMPRYRSCQRCDCRTGWGKQAAAAVTDDWSLWSDCVGGWGAAVHPESPAGDTPPDIAWKRSNGNLVFVSLCFCSVSKEVAPSKQKSRGRYFEGCCCTLVDIWRTSLKNMKDKVRKGKQIWSQAQQASYKCYLYR